MKTRKVLYADEGMVLTNGYTYGKVIFLADGENEYSFYEITDTEYERILAEQENQRDIEGGMPR